MSAPGKLWRYSLPSENGEGWAEIVVGSDGLFAAVSDWGNYAFIWRNPGVDDFRTFFLRAPTDWEYFAGKLAPDGTDGHVYDGNATLLEVKREIVARRKECIWTLKEAREEWELLAECDGLNERGDFDAWQAHTALEDSWAYGRSRWDHHLKTFCTVTLRRLADLIRAELAAEAA